MYIRIDKRARILSRDDNIIRIATIMQCTNDKHPGTTAIASMLTGKIEEYVKECLVYKVDEGSFHERRFSGIIDSRLFPRLSLVNGKSADIINLAEYYERT